MKDTKKDVEDLLRKSFYPSHLEVIDIPGGCGASFQIEIVSEQFEGKRLLERHRMVNAALSEKMKEIHALSITKASPPEKGQQQDEAEKKPEAAT